MLASFKAQRLHDAANRPQGVEAAGVVRHCTLEHVHLGVLFRALFEQGARGLCAAMHQRVVQRRLAQRIHLLNVGAAPQQRLDKQRAVVGGGVVPARAKRDDGRGVREPLGG